MKKLLANNIKKYYGKDDCIVKAVDDISLEIECGKFTSIVGTSGSGKSTLLHCMAGLDKPTFGNVYLGENDIYTLSDDELSKIRRQEFGFIFQSFNLIPVLNVYDNIILPIQLDGKKEDKEYIMSIVKKVGLEDQLKKFPNELSGGQQQRVAIARALSNKPAIIFADEPTGNLDSKTTEEVMSMLRSTVKDLNQTLLMITHDENIARQADRLITISDGKIISDEKK
ncbi:MULTISPECIES: ABC transporter ATP-binding protein [Peptostreptococcus]|uniref:ABC transporter, ATP-binding protein n=4 Tax=Peptostreptococcaceae TaxID=186804 RepID=D3MQI4_9FIRM|nr:MULTISPECIES: ABC transporter ATP-binding protein [Peptostreptococcus]MDU1255245.1 ABC transporter ATP-binding protein [Peptostreptococcaceae bacterium]MDU1664512.1 ABC transporter ATP-binding protein [Peptoniphilus harei]EFD05579.1 ABC transporter, ATP-binding protein [Peptostreptococcus anaerobius 653-L]MBS5597115.1 ABC transporter ATP-binding protein [Peptostreptococcus sp.]MDB8822053.1 ABC transporter ATP-binding protein [Peptostreptococcus anaerobius]